MSEKGYMKNITVNMLPPESCSTIIGSKKVITVFQS